MVLRCYTIWRQPTRRGRSPCRTPRHRPSVRRRRALLAHPASTDPSELEVLGGRDVKQKRERVKGREGCELVSAPQKCERWMRMVGDLP